MLLGGLLLWELSLSLRTAGVNLAFQHNSKPQTMTDGLQLVVGGVVRVSQPTGHVVKGSRRQDKGFTTPPPHASLHSLRRRKGDNHHIGGLGGCSLHQPVNRSCTWRSLKASPVPGCWAPCGMTGYHTGCMPPAIKGAGHT